MERREAIREAVLEGLTEGAEVGEVKMLLGSELVLPMRGDRTFLALPLTTKQYDRLRMALAGDGGVRPRLLRLLLGARRPKLTDMDRWLAEAAAETLPRQPG